MIYLTFKAFMFCSSRLLNASLLMNHPMNVVQFIIIYLACHSIYLHHIICYSLNHVYDFYFRNHGRKSTTTFQTGTILCQIWVHRQIHALLFWRRGNIDERITLICGWRMSRIVVESVTELHRECRTPTVERRGGENAWDACIWKSSHCAPRGHIHCHEGYHRSV